MQEDSLPIGWKIVTLKDVADYINGRAFKPSEWEKSGLPIIRIQNLNDDKASFNFTSKSYDNKFRVQHGDLLFAWSASLGAHIWYGQDAWLNQHIFQVKPKQCANKKYIYYILKHIVADLYSKTHGSGMVHITKGPFLNTKVPLPSVDIQRIIVSRIEELFSEFDKGIAELQKVKAQLKVYRQAVLKDAFSPCVQRISIRQISDIVTSGSRGWAKYYADKGATFVRIGNLTRNTISIDLTDVQYVVPPSNAEGQRTRLQDGDVLVSITADLGSIGFVHNIDEAYINQHIALIRFTNKQQSRFMAWYLKSYEGQRELLRNRRGAGKLGLGLDDIRDSKVPIVSDSESSEILSFIESRLSICDKIEQTVDDALRQAEYLHQSILKQAFEGKLVPQEQENSHVG